MPKRLVFPVQGGGQYTDDWGGARAPNATGGTGHHQGNDIFAPKGTPVVAVEDGTITKAAPSSIGGNRIWLNGRFYYAHLDSFAVKEGDKVTAGQVIGYVGNTGDAKGTAPHLHFGYDPRGGQSTGNSWADPYKLLRAADAGTPVDTGTAATDPGQEPASAPDPAAAPAASATPDDRPLQLPTTTAPGATPLPITAAVEPPGSAQHDYQPFSPAETWQRIAAQSFVGPEALRFASMFGGQGG